MGVTGQRARSTPSLGPPEQGPDRVSIECVEPLLHVAGDPLVREGAAAIAARDELRDGGRWVRWSTFVALLLETGAGRLAPRSRRWLPEDTLAIPALSVLAMRIPDPLLYFTVVWRSVLPTWLPCLSFRIDELRPGRLVLAYRVALHLRPAAFDRWLIAQVRAGVRGLAGASTRGWRVDSAGGSGRPGAVRVHFSSRRSSEANIAPASLVVGLRDLDSPAGPTSEASHPDLPRRSRLTRLSAAHGLTRRQEEVLEAILQGLSNKEIAARQGCTEATIEFHVGNLLRRLEVQSRSQLVARFWSGPQ